LIVRLFLPLALLLLASCDVANDPANEKVTVTYDRERIKQSATDAAHATRDVAKGAVNVAGSTHDAIKREVGDIDVDVDVTRRKAEQTPAE
jgi:hypothetical protein